LERNGNVFTVKGNSVQSEISGVRIPYKLSDGFYTIRFKHRSANPCTQKIANKNTRHIKCLLIVYLNYRGCVKNKLAIIGAFFRNR
jgi:hypothetical protein